MPSINRNTAINVEQRTDFFGCGVVNASNPIRSNRFFARKMVQRCSASTDIRLFLTTCRIATGEQSIQTLWQDTYLEDVVVEKHHDDTGDVERWEGGVYDEVAVVKKTEVGEAVWRVVEAQDNGTAYRCGDHPYQRDGQPYPTIVLVFCILYGLCHCDVPATRQRQWQLLSTSINTPPFTEPGGSLLHEIWGPHGVVKVKMSVFWAVRRCTQVESYQHFGGTFCHHLHLVISYPEKRCSWFFWNVITFLLDYTVPLTRRQ